MTTTFPFQEDECFFLMRRKNEPTVLACTGKVERFRHLADIPMKSGLADSHTFDSVNLIPFAQARERGFPVHDDGEPIVSLQIENSQYFPLSQFVEMLPNEQVDISNISFTTDQAEYEAIIRNIINCEIGTGQGANFVIARECVAHIGNAELSGILSIFRSLLLNEFGAYWTFAFYDGEHYYLGASPERHISASCGEVMMNPISGTYRKNSAYEVAESEKDFLEFLQDEKEIFELFMVCDEELKIMSEICDQGGSVIGPMLKEMSRLIHTEYLLVGKTDKSIIDLLRRSMFAPTVTGSPVLSAFRVIHRYEKQSRGYYGATIALVGRNKDGSATLDAPILIRTLQIDRAGKAVARVGATLVRGSNPMHEVWETETKIAGLFNAVRNAGKSPAPPERLLDKMDHEQIQRLLQSRNAYLSRFWFESQDADFGTEPSLRGKSVTIVDAEDDFSVMLKRLLEQLEMQVSLVSFADYNPQLHQSDLLVAGPGPGNPLDSQDGKMMRLRNIIAARLESGQAMLCVCLSHQILCDILGFPVITKAVPLQGTQQVIDLFGTQQRVGFYNTYVGLATQTLEQVRVASDEESREIHALQGERFFSVQFHPESILTPHGFELTRKILSRLLLTRQFEDRERPVLIGDAVL
ncbi:chorismate-binding protein [Chromobacterium subtsugae]|uniref:chorismate-binding protein n=1 Tax=Chromobacterium subtsugae TaxID=251747 RepID=UPI000ADF66C2|nr:chorismate-binding protein [Chromobacterium subtsugae]